MFSAIFLMHCFLNCAYWFFCVVSADSIFNILSYTEGWEGLSTSYGLPNTIWFPHCIFSWPHFVFLLGINLSLGWFTPAPSLAPHLAVAKELCFLCRSSSWLIRIFFCLMSTSWLLFLLRRFLKVLLQSFTDFLMQVVYYFIEFIL